MEKYSLYGNSLYGNSLYGNSLYGNSLYKHLRMYERRLQALLHKT